MKGICILCGGSQCFRLVIEALLRSSVIVLKQDDDSFKFPSRDRDAFGFKRSGTPFLMRVIKSFHLGIEGFLGSSLWAVDKNITKNYLFRSRHRSAFEVKFTPPYPAEEIILFRSRHRGAFAVKPLYST